MTKSEAREIYNLQIALARTFRKDIFDLCARKGVPEEWVLDFIEEDITFDAFFARHLPDGSLKSAADEPRAERLRRIVRLAVFGDELRN